MILSIGFASQLPSLRFNHSISAFFPQNSQETLFFDEYKSIFGNDNDQILLSLRAPSSVFDSTFIHAARHFQGQLGSLPGITEIYSPFNIPRYVRSSFRGDLKQRTWIGPSGPYAEDSTRIFDSGYGPEIFFSKDKQSVFFWVFHEPEGNSLSCLSMSQKVDSLLETVSFAEVHSVGKCLNQSLYINTLEQESLLFTSLAVLLIALLLWWTFRSLAGVLIPLIMIGLTVLWTVGLMIWMGESLNLVSHILPVILMVISMSDVVHLRTHYLSLSPTYDNRIESFRHSVRTIGKATLFTSLTTAVGFLTLTTSSFRPVVELGMYASIGLAFALILTYAVSGSLIIIGKSTPSSLPATTRLLDQFLTWCYRQVEEKPRTILISSGVLLILGLSGSFQLEVNNYLLDDLDPAHPHQLDFRYFETEHGGPRPIEISISTTKDSFLTVSQVEEIRMVREFLESDWKADILLSPDLVILQANQIYHFGRKSGKKLPEDQDRIDELMFGMLDSGYKILGQTWMSEDRTRARLSGRIGDVGSKVFRQMEERFEQFLQTDLPHSSLEFQITGTSYLMDLNTSFLAENILYGLAAALLFIAILFAYQLRSWPMVVISLIVNILPLLVLGGMMGWIGMDLKISTSFVFVVAFGIAVDDSIHFLSRLRQELMIHPMNTAIHQAFFHSGKAILLTTLILLGGFLTFCFSDFLGTFYFGVLIGTSLVLALLADLLLLPVLLFFVFPLTSDRERSSSLSA